MNIFLILPCLKIFSVIHGFNTIFLDIINEVMKVVVRFPPVAAMWSPG